jgi:hypothetical protein
VSAVTAIDDAPSSRSEYWCCGTGQPPGSTVHLGNHPEVAVCVRCAHSVHSQAWEIEDRTRTGAAVRARDAFRALRRGVAARGWHTNRLIGGRLRWLGRHLP